MTKSTRKAPRGPGPKTAQRRSAARLTAVQALYEMDIVDAPADAVLEEFLQKRWSLSGDDTETDGTSAREQDAETMVEPEPDWLGDLVRGVNRHSKELDGLIGPALDGNWTLERIETLVRVILRAAAYELTNKPDIPAEVVISEYLDVAHAFFSGKEAGFINGVLDRLAHEIRSGEF